MNLFRIHFALTLLFLPSFVQAGPLNFRPQEIAKDLTIGYAVNLLDMNNDGKTDILVVDKARVIWYENPTWQVHTIIQDQTDLDNVCIAPYDIDGDGQVEFALGAFWQPANTKTGGTIQWLRRGKTPADRWEVRRIDEEPTTHRMRWIDVNGDGRKELVVVPLFGRETKGPDFAERGVRILAYHIPKDPVADRWVPQVLNDDMHVTHNFWPTDMDKDGRADILVTSFEGVNLLRPGAGDKWTRTRLGEGNQTSTPSRGASEIKLGRLASGADYIATIEPWHGFQVVVYTRPPSAGDALSGQTLWPRQVVDDDLKWGHAVWCANLDADADDELIIGIRDNKNEQALSGLRIYDPQNTTGTEWQRHVLDPGGVAIEDLSAADMNGDGRIDIVAVGRATKNVKIYWNETK